MSPVQSDVPSSTPNLVTRIAAWFYFQVYVLALRWLGHLSPPKAIKFSGWINPLFTFPFRGLRQRNIELLFPAFTKLQRHQIEKDYLKYVARTRADFGWLIHGATHDDVRNTVALHGREHLDAALARGRGVLILEAHVGNWTFTPVILALLQYPLGAVSNGKALGTMNLSRLHQRLARKYGFQLGHVGQTGYEAARAAFRRNGIFYLNLDVAVSIKRLEWFRLGSAALAVDSGPAVLARRHRVPVLFARSLQTARGTSITLFPQLEPDKVDAVESSRRQLPDAWSGIMRQVILEHVTQWWSLQYVQLRKLPNEEDPVAL